jgi:hypothetical protein
VGRRTPLARTPLAHCPARGAYPVERHQATRSTTYPAVLPRLLPIPTTSAPLLRPLRSKYTLRDLRWHQILTLPQRVPTVLQCYLNQHLPNSQLTLPY